METIGKNIMKLRIEKKLSQKDLSELSGVSRSYITEIEKDAYNISIVILCDLCKALNVTPNELIPEHLYKEVK